LELNPNWDKSPETGSFLKKQLDFFSLKACLSSLKQAQLSLKTCFFLKKAA
jgi:hypothetical protein